MSQNNPIIVRFPPSPTGLLHMGNVRTAIYNYLFARKNGGKFIIRVEDTDKARSKKEYEEDMFESMRWLGLEHDNEGNEWRSSERIEVYKQALQKLIANGAAYISAETEGENKEVVRFKNPGGKIKFEDLIRGEVEIDVSDLNDFIIARNIDDPLYHLAVCVDDTESGVTHIIRGEDHISNTPRHILIIEALGQPKPIYAHLPMILAEDKSKLSKRKHGEAVSLKYYRDKGYEPEAILNFLALIGWNPGTDQEIFSLPELIEKFDLSKVQKKGGIFNIQKLDWFNREWILRESKEKQLQRLKSEIRNTKFETNPKWENEDFVNKFLKLMLDKIHRWGEVSELLGSSAGEGEFDYLFEKPVLDPAKIPWKTQTLEQAKENLKKVLAQFDEVERLATELGKGEVLWPLRYVLSGREKSPDPFTLLSILGQPESADRVKSAIEQLGG